MLKKLSSFLNLFIALAVLAIVGFYSYNKYGQKVTFLQPKVKALSAVDQDNLVNEILAKTARDKMLVRATNKKMEDDLRAQIKKISAETQEKLARDQANMPLDRQIHKDNSGSSLPSSPSEFIQGQVNQRILEKKQAEQDLEEYKRQFKENARRGGYEVELDASGEVLRATPIREPSGSDSYESSPSD